MLELATLQYLEFGEEYKETQNYKMYGDEPQLGVDEFITAR